jgi:hypothetical protein
MDHHRVSSESQAPAGLDGLGLQLRPANVRAAWFTLAIDIYRTYERALDAANTDRKRASAVRRLKAARPAIQHMLRDAELADDDRTYLVWLLARIERYFVHIPPDRAAA